MPSRGQGRQERKRRKELHGMKNERKVLHITYISRTDLKDRITVK